MKSTLGLLREKLHAGYFITITKILYKKAYHIIDFIILEKPKGKRDKVCISYAREMLDVFPQGTCQNRHHVTNSFVLYQTHVSGSELCHVCFIKHKQVD